MHKLINLSVTLAAIGLSGVVGFFVGHDEGFQLGKQDATADKVLKCAGMILKHNGKVVE